MFSDKLDTESSHYESYGEEEDEDVPVDRAHYIQCGSSQPCLRPVPESRLCEYLWRKKWLGQWTRQLFIIKHDSLLVNNQKNTSRRVFHFWYEIIAYKYINFCHL